MDALEFAKELKRMCDSHLNGCYECDCCVGGNRLCDAEKLEKAIPIVEKWSKEHPKVTNLDHIAEGLEKLGYKVDKNYLSTKCPVPYGKNFTDEDIRCPSCNSCNECLKWWEKEYKEKNNG